MKKVSVLLFFSTILLSPLALGHEDCATPFDVLPDLCEIATTKSVRSGAWSSSRTWSNGRVPRTQDVVEISEDTEVVLDMSPTVKAVCIHGKLTFRRTSNISLKTETVFVHNEGTLEIGTETEPIPSTVNAQIIIADKPLDLHFDPKQYLNGLVVMGKIRLHGAAKNPTFARLAVEPKAGDWTLTLSEPVEGWLAGDVLVLPDSRLVSQGAILNAYPYRPETAVVASVSGNVVTLTAPLADDHPGAVDADGTLRFLPHVANLSRNVIVKSENPAGTRGHAFFTYRADVDIRYAQFEELGRTTIAPLDNTVLNNHDIPIHIGTNQIGRYAFHLHHVWGPSNPANAGYPFQAIGNSILNSQRWALVMHDSHFGLISQNVIYNGRGSGIVTEMGNETENEIESNFIAGMSGDANAPDDFQTHGGDEEGTKGAGLWTKGPHNYIRRNVIANCRRASFYLGNIEKRASVPVPLFRGADITENGQFVLRTITDLVPIDISGNETYASFNGFYSYKVGGDNENGGVVTLRNSSAWANSRAAFAMYYDQENVKIRGAVIRGGREVPPRDNCIGMRGDVYSIVDAENVSIEGVTTGAMTVAGHSSILIRNADLKNVNNVEIIFINPRPEGVTNRLENVGFGAIPGRPLVALSMSVRIENEDGSVLPNWDKSMQTFVTDYNKIPGRNFQAFFVEQEANWVIPRARGAEPCRGLTNQECSDRHGKSLANEIAKGHVQLPEVPGGYVRWIDGSAPVLSIPSISGMTTTSAVISWTTNEESTSRVSFGLTPNYTDSAFNNNFATNHTLTLNGLAPETLYHCQAHSVDAAGNASSSEDLTFRTAPLGDTTPPYISEVRTPRVRPSAAVIQWRTDEAATTQIEYGPNSDYGLTTLLDSRLTVSHQAKITRNLSPQRTYHFRVISRDAAGNLSTSIDYLFTTA